MEFQQFLRSNMERWMGMSPNHAPMLYSLCKNGKGVGNNVIFHTDIKIDIKEERKICIFCTVRLI